MEICINRACTGCGLCSNICPKNAVLMKSNNATGHLNPVINKELCIECGLCNCKCPQNSTFEGVLPIKTYAAWQKDEIKQKGSSSGGVASAFYEDAISRGYYVVGAVLCDDFSTKLIVTNDITDIEKFKSSKYEQAEANDVYNRITEILKNGGKVLFIGTPCQCAAVKEIGKAYATWQLIIVDLICHGVPSYTCFMDYIRWIEKEKKTKITSVSFRTIYGEELVLKNGEKIIWDRRWREDFYLYAFNKGLICNEACYQCKYAYSNRISDITIGDFWGIGKQEPFEHPGRKVSVIAVGTQKGVDFVNMCSDLVLVERSYDEAVLGNSQLKNPAKKHHMYNKFWSLYSSEGIESAFKGTIYTDVENFYRKEHLKDIIKAPLRKIRRSLIKR